MRSTGSWVISEKATGKAVAEVFNAELLPFVNTEKYMIETAAVYLGRFNASLKQD